MPVAEAGDLSGNLVYHGSSNGVDGHSGVSFGFLFKTPHWSFDDQDV